MRSFKSRTHYCLRSVLGVCLLLFSLGCANRSTPPGPSTLHATGPGLNFALLSWKEGLRILIVDDVEGGFSSKGHGSTSNPIYTIAGGAAPAKGDGYKWKAETKDGVTAAFHLHGKEYDLAKGTVFAVKSKDDGIEVHQLTRDLNMIPFDTDACRNFLKKDNEIQEIFTGGDGAK